MQDSDLRLMKFGTRGECLPGSVAISGFVAHFSAATIHGWRRIARLVSNSRQLSFYSDNLPYPVVFNELVKALSTGSYETSRTLYDRSSCRMPDVTTRY